MSQLSALSLPEALAALRVAVRARRRLIALVAVLVAAATIALNVAAPHEARSVISFSPYDQSRTLALLGIPAPAPPTVDQLRSDFIFERMVRDRVAPPNETVESLRDKLSVVSSEPRQGATLEAFDDSEAGALSLLNAWTTTISASRQDLIVTQFDRVRAAFAAQLDGLEGRARADDRRAIRAQLSRLDAAKNALPPEVSVVGGATLVTESGQHNELLALVLGAAGGVLLGLGLELRESRLRTPAAAAAAFGAPVLGSLDLNNREMPDSSPDALASRLETSLAVQDGSKASQVVLITSSAGVEDPRAAVLDLARALERKRQSVEVVIWEGDPDEVAQRVAELRRRARFVLILAPAPRTAPGVLLLAGWADAWLVLVALDQTSGDAAKELDADLEGIALHPAGIVLAEATSREEPK